MVFSWRACPTTTINRLHVVLMIMRMMMKMYKDEEGDDDDDDGVWIQPLRF